MTVFQIFSKQPVFTAVYSVPYSHDCILQHLLPVFGKTDPKQTIDSLYNCLMTAAEKVIISGQSHE